jgi:hypothetical protein
MSLESPTPQSNSERLSELLLGYLQTLALAGGLVRMA